jgi:hypothetical protein
MTKAGRRRFRKWSRRLFVVNIPSNFSLQITDGGFLGPCNDGERSFSTQETVQQKYTPNKQVHKPYTAVETRVQSRLGPWLPVKLI